MNQQELNKIALAIIEKYGTEKGVELLIRLIQEINKPADVKFVHEANPVRCPYPLTGYPSYLYPTQPHGLDDKLTCNSNQ